MDKWEYCLVQSVAEPGYDLVIRAFSGNGEVLEGGTMYLEVFNKLGEDGWEMCGPKAQMKNSFGNTSDVFYFKRKKQFDE